MAEFDDGAVVAFEVKANEHTTGRRSFTYEDHMHVMPIDRLWQPVELK